MIYFSLSKRRGELPESPSNVVLSPLLNPLLFSILQHPTSLPLFGRFPGRPLSTRRLSCLRFILVFFNFHNKIMWHYIKAGQSQFLPHSFQFICLLFPYHLTLIERVYMRIVVEVFKELTGLNSTSRLF